MTETRQSTLLRFAGFSRNLGMQAAASAIVMVALHGASVAGYDLDRWLSPGAPAAVGPQREATRVVGVPARFDPPVQAGGAIEEIARHTGTTGAPHAAPAPLPPAADRAAPEVAVLPPPARVAVPSPRPSEPVPVTVAMREAPDALPFDVSLPQASVRDAGAPVELVASLEESPVPPETGDRFTLGSIVPSGSAILHGAGEVTGVAAHVVTGTASRVLDLVR